MFTAITLTHRRLAVALCAVAVAVALGACGSSSPASSSSAAAAGGASGSTAGSTTARLNLAKCFRAQGISVSDSGTATGAGAGGGGGGGIFSAFRNYPRAKVEAALTACKQYVAAAFPAATLTPAARAARTQQLVKYATCMRSHGVNIPDPTTSGGGPGGGGFAFGAGAAGGGSNFRALLNTPAYKTANTACASLRPKFGGGRFGGGGRAAGAAGA